MIRVHEIRKRYGATTALGGVSLEVPDGLVTELLGPNGAGKTTTIRSMTGLVQPDAGWVEVDEAMAFIAKTLTTHPYIAGDKFTGADILYATTFGMFAQNPMMPKLASIDAYVKRVLDRPAYARAQEREQG